MGNRGYQNRLGKDRILTAFSYRLAISCGCINPGSGRLPDVIRDGLVLRRARMKAIGGEPVVAAVVLPADGGDVDVLRCARLIPAQQPAEVR